MKGCGDHLVEMGERGSGTRQAVFRVDLEPRTLWIRSPGELEETAHNGRVRLNPSNRPAGESAALPSRGFFNAAQGSYLSLTGRRPRIGPPPARLGGETSGGPGDDFRVENRQSEYVR